MFSVRAGDPARRYVVVGDGCLEGEHLGEGKEGCVANAGEDCTSVEENEEGEEEVGEAHCVVDGDMQQENNQEKTKPLAKRGQVKKSLQVHMLYRLIVCTARVEDSYYKIPKAYLATLLAGLATKRKQMNDARGVLMGMRKTSMMGMSQPKWVIVSRADVPPTRDGGTLFHTLWNISRELHLKSTMWGEDKILLAKTVRENYL